MVDYAKCNAKVKIENGEMLCPIREHCYRFQAPESERQGWIAAPGRFITATHKNHGGWLCRGFMPCKVTVATRSEGG